MMNVSKHGNIRTQGSTQPAGRKFFSLRCLCFVTVILLLALSWPFESHAQSTTSPAMDSSCQNMSQYGFTLGLVYCIQTSIGTAVTQYITALKTNLSYYEGTALMLAVALFGFKMMNSNLQEPLKESMTFVVKVLIGVFLYSQAGTIYTDIAGTTTSGGSTGIMNQAIGWVTGTGGSGSGGDTSLMANLVSSNCTAPTPPSNFQGYQVWQAIDCMFSKMIGAANPTDHPYAFGTSLAIVGTASLLSGTLGVMISMLALQAMIGAFLMIFRAIYLVLLSYLTIGFLAVLTPLIAPLLFFESKFLTEKFKRWVGLIISTIFQPVFVLGFLAMAISVADPLIEGDPGTCTKQPTYPTTTSKASDEPTQGWGQDGTGLCSFSQLFNHDVNSTDSSTVQTDSNNGAQISAAFANFFQHNQTLFTQNIGGDPQMLGYANNQTRVNTNSNSDYSANAKTGTIMAAQQDASFASNTSFAGATTNKKYLPIKQLTLTLLTFIFVVFVMKALMNDIPRMASNITIMVGVNLFRFARTPIEGVVSSAFNGAKENMYKNAQGKGLLSGNFDGFGSQLSTLRAGIKGGASAGWNRLKETE